MTRMKSLWKASPRKVLLAFGGAVGRRRGCGRVGSELQLDQRQPQQRVHRRHDLVSSNSKANAAILTASNIVPGNTATGSVTIKNTGSASGTFTLAPATPVDTPASPGLSKKLTLTIVDHGDPTCVTSCPAAVTLYTGTIFAEPATIALGAFIPNAQHSYKFTMTFPDGGTNGADNAYQGASTSVDYSWFSTS